MGALPRLLALGESEGAIERPRCHVQSFHLQVGMPRAETVRQAEQRRYDASRMAAASRRSVRAAVEKAGRAASDRREPGRDAAARLVQRDRALAKRHALEA